MKTYITIFYILIGAVTFTSGAPKKELSHESVALNETLTKVFKEPLLTDPQFKDKDIYRFTIFPTFDKPMIFRLEVIDESQGIIYYKRLSGKGGYELGTIEASSSSTLKGDAFTELLKIFKSPRIFKPYGNLAKKDIDQLSGLDGSTWYLEQRSKNVYSRVGVWEARQLLRIKESLLDGGERGKKVKNMHQIFKQLDLKPFLSACISLAQAAGYEPNDELEMFVPIKIKNKHK